MKKLKTSFFLSLFLLICVTVQSQAQVDTVMTFSKSMSKEIKAVIISPERLDASKQYPVTYLLHGYSGNYKSWIEGVPELVDLAERYQMIIVTPDGNFDSWYWDSPEKPESNYETYIAQELVSFVDANYPTINSKEGRAITGLSMGGHGALFLAFRHQDIFGAAGSQSGGVDITPFPESWNMKSYLGAKSNFPQRWKDYSVMGQIHLLSRDRLPIIIHCGTDDFFYPANLKLHEELTYQNIPHTFTANPGGHNWDYWKESVQYQLLFFHNFFRSSKP
ncbi:alpha/beta hydrolase [Algoriphagus vanfongensis]|uniref:alpha/beta hydrolase n=1 Tax=Algoriphagus vanfongensis TaxID=426371 RepID=UPI00041FEF7D|nr:alpha/beta hydrolase family protein [Algoriphagus vanfongensis]